MTTRVLVRLGRVNATAAFLVTTVLVLAALVIGGWFGGLVLLAILAGLIALLTKSWPILDAKAKGFRVVVLTLLLVVALAQFTR